MSDIIKQIPLTPEMREEIAKITHVMSGSANAYCDQVKLNERFGPQQADAIRMNALIYLTIAYLMSFKGMRKENILEAVESIFGMMYGKCDNCQAEEN